MSELAIAGTHEQVAFTDSGGAGGGVVDDAANEQAVAFFESDGTAQFGGHVRGSEGDTETGALVAAPFAHRRDAVAQIGIGRAGEIEAVVDAVGVDADDLAVAVDHWGARGSRG